MLTASNGSGLLAIKFLREAVENFPTGSMLIQRLKIYLTIKSGF